MERFTLSVLIALASASAEFYQLDNLLSENPNFSSIDKRTGRELDARNLLLDVGTLDSLNATTNTCKVVGAGIRCDVQTVVKGGGDKVDLRIQVDCPLDSQVAFDFRRASGCQCGAAVKHWDGKEKYCPCIVCPLGFGNSPISIDCSMREDPFIVANCSYLDCGFGCNGTCEFNCRNSGPSCPYCANNPNAPTPAPTGPDKHSRPPSLIPSHGERVPSTSVAFALLVSGAFYLLL